MQSENVAYQNLTSAVNMPGREQPGNSSYENDMKVSFVVMCYKTTRENHIEQQIRESKQLLSPGRPY